MDGGQINMPMMIIDSVYSVYGLYILYTHTDTHTLMHVCSITLVPKLIFTNVPLYILFNRHSFIFVKVK